MTLIFKEFSLTLRNCIQLLKSNLIAANQTTAPSSARLQQANLACFENKAAYEQLISRVAQRVVRHEACNES